MYFVPWRVPSIRRQIPDDFKSLPDELGESAVTGQIELHPGAGSAAIDVIINGDWIPEHDEEFEVFLLDAGVYEIEEDGSSTTLVVNPNGYVERVDPQGVGTIIDDDFYEFDFVRRYDKLGPDNPVTTIESGGTIIDWNDAEGTAAVAIGGDPNGLLRISGPFAKQQISHWNILPGDELNPENNDKLIVPDFFQVEIEIDGNEIEPFYVGAQDGWDPLTAFAFGKPLQLDSGDGIYMSEVTVTAFIESPSGGDPFEVGEKVKEFSFPVIDLEDSAGGSGWIPHETYRLLPEIAIDGTRPSSLADSPGSGLLKPDGSVWHLAAGGGSAGMFDVLKSRTDGDGWQLDQPNGSVLLFDAEGRLESFADRNGNERTYTYTDGNGDGESLELETITDVFGLTKTFHYAAGTLDKVVDFAGREWDYEVTGGKLRNVIWPKSEIGGGAGASWSLHYNEPDSPWLVTIVDPALGQTVFTFAEFTDHNIDPETGSDRTFDFFRLNGFTRADGAVRSVEPLKLMALATQETAPENPFYDVELPENIQSTAMFRQVSTTVKMDDFQQPVSTDSSDGDKTTQDRYENGLVQMFQPLVDNGVSPDYHYEYDARGRVELIKYPDGTTDDFL